MALKMIGIYKNNLKCLSYGKKLFEYKSIDVKPNRIAVYQVDKNYSSRGYIPASQYDMPWPKKFNLAYALKTYWELTPLAFLTGFVIFLVIFSTYKALKNKVDCVYETHLSKNTISRTMDLRHPTVHKLIIINQRYEPWPEMQKVLDLMKCAEDKQMNVIYQTVCDDISLAPAAKSH